jgi:UDP-glucose:(heptosyl)LPS alpha-1,3-glucosyltransferase
VALVVHDVDSENHGGLERIFTELVRRGSSQVDFTVVSNTLSPDMRRQVRWLRVPAIRRPFVLKFLIFFCLAQIRLSRERHDLVHSVGAVVPGPVDLASVQYCYAAYVQRVGAPAPRGASPLRRLNAALGNLASLAAERWGFRPGRVRLLAAASDSTRRELARHYPGVPAMTTPNGVDLGAFTPDPGRRAEVRRREAVADQELVCLFVGGDWARKGVDHTIRGVAAAQRTTSRPLLLWIVGQGDQRRMQALADAHGVGGRVRFFGFRPEVEQFYQAADLFLLPTLYEAFPLVALEAAASALPIVATRVSGVDELIGDGQAGLLVERSAEAIGDAVARLAADDELRSRLAETARLRAAAYTWDRSVASVLEAYRGLLDQPSAAAELAAAER